MGFWQGNSYGNLETQHRQALHKLDCSKSVGVILDFIQHLETLEYASDHNRPNEYILFIAGKCCENQIVSYSQSDFSKAGLVGLRKVQDDILNKIASISGETPDTPQAFYNIAMDGQCQTIISYCRKKIAQLGSAH